MEQNILNLFIEIRKPAFTVAFTFGFGSKLVRWFLDMSLNGSARLK